MRSASIAARHDVRHGLSWRATLGFVSTVMAKFLILSMAFVAVTLGCEQKKAPAQRAPVAAKSIAPAPPPAPVDPAVLAAEIFTRRCTVCHGPSGKGDGPGAAALNPKPQAFSDAAWQARVSDEELRKVIVEGGPAVGRTAGMPPNPDLADKPEVVGELVRTIRKFKG